MHQEGYEVEYLDVVEDAGNMEEMLKFSQGERKVPVLVEGEKVTVGFGGT